MSGADDMPKPGHRKDGQPYKEGNTREDGSYLNGKGRTPEHGKFRKDDGRKRGKREKGGKNQETIWRKALDRKVNVGGETKTAAEWLVDALIRRGINRSDRAAEKALEQAERLERTNERTISGREDEIIAAYLSQRFAEIGVKISEDAPNTGDNTASGSEGSDGDAHQ